MAVESRDASKTPSSRAACPPHSNTCRHRPTREALTVGTASNDDDGTASDQASLVCLSVCLLRQDFLLLLLLMPITLLGVTDNTTHAFQLDARTHSKILAICTTNK